MKQNKLYLVFALIIFSLIGGFWALAIYKSYYKGYNQLNRRVIILPKEYVTRAPTEKELLAITEEAKKALSEEPNYEPGSITDKDFEITFSEIKVYNNWAWGDVSYVPRSGEIGGGTFFLAKSDENQNWIAAINWTSQFLTWFPEAGKYFMDPESFKFMLKEHYELK
ncbi:hypothetical protein A3C98_05410 [Candidatus Roizmanbacteria bacterium RIFCSPHIGHO2_02_FULL_37_15]|uniref:Uncharacterized protein n=1 Tax=Candidatus Roizmanbacteria bacterium RIFCSPLOWO2_01_FULL_37_16 TaxID=1802058 RepID=A0A1F7IM37_9BACT|nr:MAG: hypothetical protein A2859_04065 [Candidatus Roizmanbacteria bacterium RIFCSPHIGHO2_01_FULL_37_16b]OGK22367.1 MAG: hypothetical protein A3C98_05410 [Candidatus Roizmanbacteria bacterium RIFCSPHIGHO2_02_FULL_37_15]OGK33208.1 MAG: hypothetical protein A3F57_05070 [Candidatus Roizmanbacteria bacterium RIFCSPHIGHO2_12_FULL_36_11]OGK44382.1 MAG: hypothetical protein A3B40_04665 [Candidatus Roizmanbacteria bacterium RIFCSPLOWO2_01_FULL_37_16]OGK57631.1 MAG: hypothetical protein A3I50_00520 [C